ncbi:hypothetical protein J6590_052205 [Homalodisca vitripennis]|nr:hypothetical protein J6590_052205 [Homalodisca vitripennis]
MIPIVKSTTSHVHDQQYRKGGKGADSLRREIVGRSSLLLKREANRNIAHGDQMDEWGATPTLQVYVDIIRVWFPVYVDIITVCTPVYVDIITVWIQLYMDIIKIWIPVYVNIITVCIPVYVDIITFWIPLYVDIIRVWFPVYVDIISLNPVCVDIIRVWSQYIVFIIKVWFPVYVDIIRVWTSENLDVTYTFITSRRLVCKWKATVCRAVANQGWRLHSITQHNMNGATPS